MEKRRPQIWALAGAAMACGVSLDVPPAHAAVRLCREPILSEATGKTEPVARRKAIDGWIEQASVYGPAYTAWRLAADKTFECAQSQGLFVCRAAARPCGIEQVAPPGWAPMDKKPKKEFGA